MIIGIAGSSGAGKSTVCEILKKLYDSKIINADEIAKKLSIVGTEYLAEITQTFGKEVLLKNGELNRKKLSNIIYKDEKQREKLNDCTFKYIKKEINNQIESAKEELIVIDAPLLFESKSDEICDITVAVICENREVQINRIIERDHIEKEDAIARLNAQHPNEFYIKNCQYVLINNDSLEEQIKEFISKINSI